MRGMSSETARAAMPSPATDDPFFRLAMGLAKEAVALDKKKQFDAAITKYTRASEALVEFMKVARNPGLVRLCAEKVLEYLSRAKFLWAKLHPGDQRADIPTVARVTPVHAPPKSCEGCRFYDQYCDDCQSVQFHLMRERRGENLQCPSKEIGTALQCPGGKCYGCTPGAGCDD